MGNETFEDKWKEMRDQAKGWWSRLTDTELEQTGGNPKKIVDLIQRKYRMPRQRAIVEFNRRVRGFKGKAESGKASPKTNKKR